MAKKTAKKKATISKKTPAKRPTKKSIKKTAKKAPAKGKKPSSKKGVKLTPDVDDVDVKEYPKNQEKQNVRIFGSGLKDGIPKFRTTTSPVNWSLKIVNNNNDNVIIVHATNRFRSAGTGSDTDDLIITVDSSAPETFDITFVP